MNTEIYHQAVFLDLESIDRDDMDVSILRQSVSNWQFHGMTRPEEIIRAVGNAEIVVTNKVVLDQAILSQLPDLKLICVAATGTNNVDIAAAKALGISVCNVTSYATPAVVQHVFRLILALSGRLWENTQAAVDGQWSASHFFCLLDFIPVELTGKKLGIIGYGELGQAVAKAAACFGMEVLIARRDDQDQRPGRIALDELLPQLDILSLHCPLTDENFNLIGQHELDLLPANALLINTARGGLVDEQALLQALGDKKIAGAGLDVLANEPPETTNPLLQSKLKNLIITPHIAWASQQARQRLLDEVAFNIQAFQQGKTRNKL